MATLQAGESIDAVVDYDTLEIDGEALEMAGVQGRHTLGPNELAYKRASLAVLKQSAVAGIEDLTVLKEWPNLGSSFLRFDSEQALTELLERPQVVRVHAPHYVSPSTEQSLVLVRQPPVAAAGLKGGGKTIAIFDTGIDSRLPVFGSCTSTDPPEPVGCRVIATTDPIGDDDPYDELSGHGTLVSAIAATVAPEADLVFADVIGFVDENGDGIPESPSREEAVIEAISWAIAMVEPQPPPGEIQPPQNLVAINMSFAINPDVPNPPQLYTEPCPNAVTALALGDAMMAGIQPIAAAGNEAKLFAGSEGFIDGVRIPACVPGVVSVGAVYDNKRRHRTDEGCSAEQRSGGRHQLQRCHHHCRPPSLQDDLAEADYPGTVGPPLCV